MFPLPLPSRPFRPAPPMSKHLHSSNAALACIQSMVELACCIPTMAGRSERRKGCGGDTLAVGATRTATAASILLWRTVSPFGSCTAVTFEVASAEVRR